MLEVDSTIQFYTWKESKKIGADRIKKETDIPEDLKGFSKFSSKFFVHPNSKSMTISNVPHWTYQGFIRLL